MTIAERIYQTLWSTSNAPAEGVTPFAQQPEHTIWTFQAELRKVQDALSPRGPESLAALEHALSIGRAWWEQCGLTLFRQGVRVSRLPLSYLRETVGVSSYEDCGLLSCPTNASWIISRPLPICSTRKPCPAASSMPICWRRRRTCASCPTPTGTKMTFPNFTAPSWACVRPARKKCTPTACSTAGKKSHKRIPGRLLPSGDF